MHWYLIHGAASTRLSWTSQLRALPQVSRASLPPLRQVEPEHLIEAWADWCLEDMGRPSIVMGHSMGGAIAQIMALKAPAMVQGLVLVGTGPRLPVNAALIESLQATPREALGQIARWSLSKSTDPTLLKRSIEQAQRYDAEQAHREFLACNAFDSRNQLSRFFGPTALIAADQDRMTPVSRLMEFHEFWPNAPLFMVKDAGHMMMLEQPIQFNTILAEISHREEFGTESTS